VVKGFDCTVICGHRNEEDQQKVFAQGYSKVQYPNSKHNSLPSKAIDIMPYPLSLGKNKNYYYFMAGTVKAIATQMNIKIRWGGDWNSNNIFEDNTFEDLVHFEINE
jgi:peptidoglycan L-alanyl-D-glutamate endopeptidase CwlK